MNLGRSAGRMTTGIERFFRPVSLNEIIIFQEMYHHYIHFLDENGNITSSKLDKVMPGKYYREAKEKEWTIHGLVEYTFPDGKKRKLIGLGEDMNGIPIL